MKQDIFKNNKIRGSGFLRNGGVVSVGGRRECLVLSTKLIIKDNLTP